MRFALVLSDSLEQQRAAVRSFKEDFHFLLQMEERARSDDGLSVVLRHIVWRQDPLVRLLFILWDRSRGDEIDYEALEITKQMFDHHPIDSANKTQTSNPTVFAPRHETNTHASWGAFCCVESWAQFGRQISKIRL